MAQKGVYVSLVTLDGNDEMVVKIEDPSLSMLDDPLSLEGCWPMGKSRRAFTDFQRQQLENAFHNAQYLTVETRKKLAFSTGLLEKQIQIWFQNQRSRWKLGKKPINQPREMESMLFDNENLKEEYISLLESKLKSEEIKSTRLNDQLIGLRCQYVNLVFRKNKIARELEKERLKNHQLNNKVQKLTNSNEIFIKNLNAIAIHIKKVLP